MWIMPTDHSIHPFDANKSRDQLVKEPAGSRARPASVKQQYRELSQELTRRKSEKRSENERRLRTGIRGWRIVLFLLFLSLSTFTHHPLAALAQNHPDGQAFVKPQRILVLCSYGYSLPAYQKLNPAFLAVMENAGASPNNVFFEYLDLLRINDEDHRLALADMLRHKYAQTGIDLIVTLHAPAMTFLLNEAKDISPNVPLMSWNVQEAFKEEDTKHRIFRLVINLDVQGTLERALELFPQTRRVVLISGVSQMDRQTEAEAKSVFGNWQDMLQFEYTSSYSVEEILERVANLPPRSIIIYCNIFEDKTGRTFTPRDVGQMVAKTANAPVFGLYDTLLGHGVVGGSLLSFEAEGARAGNLALDILNGKISRAEQTTTMAGKPIPMFDWQQIERWGGQVRKLAAGSILINRPASLWDQYAWYIIGLVALFLGQLFLVASLLIQRRRRGRAEEELKAINETLEQRVTERTAELQESEARYRSLFNTMTEGFALHEIITDADGKPCDYRFLEINPAFERLTGLSCEAALGKTVREVIPNIELYWIETYGRVALDGTPVHIENYSAPLSRWYEVFAYRSAPGQFAVVFTDITERKQAEAELRQSRKDLDRAQEVGQIGSWRMDVLRNVLTWSDENHRIFGVPKGTPLTYETFLEIVHPDDRQNVDKQWKASLRGEPYDIEHRLLVTGEVRWVREKAYLEFDEAGKLLGGFGITQDITDRKHAEQALRQLSQFPEENPNPVLRCTPDGVTLHINAPARRWLTTLGWQADGALPAPVRAAVAEARGQDHAIETEITDPGGRTFSIFAVQPPGEDYINLYGIDFTDRKRAEEALRESEERLRASLGEKEVLLKEIHHRVKNNMQVISSLVALHADELRDGAMRAVLLDVTHRVRSMAMVHEKLYESADLARIEFAEYARSLLNYLWRAHATTASGVRLALDLEPVSLPVNAAVPCGLILNELVGNALKHAFRGRAGGEVTVSLRSGPPDRVRLSVRDNGTGLPPGLDWRQGRSLGLRLVQMLAGQLHAAVELSNSGGTEFTITFEGLKT
jgi:PAS domain S-box-containing protein